MLEANDQLRSVLEDRVRFETLISEIASEFVDLDLDRIDGAVEGAQRRLVEALGVDRSALYQISDADGALALTHYWSRSEFPPVPSHLPAPAEMFPWMVARLLRGEIVSFWSLDELPPDVADRDSFKRIGTKSNVSVPLVASGRVIGVLTFGALREERVWPPKVITRLRLVGQIFASTLARKRAEADLRQAVDDRLGFETLIVDLASQFVNLDSDRIDESIEDAQRRLVQALDVDRSVLSQFVGDALVFTHSWSQPDVPPFTMKRYTATSMFPWSQSKIARGEIVSFSSVKELPPDMPDREHYERIGTKSAAIMPLIVSGRSIGSLTFGVLRRERAWPSETVNRLSLIAQVFASALARTRAEAELRRTLEENVRLRDRLAQVNVYLQHEVKERRGPDVMGHSSAIRRVLEEANRVAPTAATVLLLGETGTGKELIATTIHERSPRQSHAMVRVNCAAIPTALIESEMFGREKGAYTGALARQTGRFEVADGSTIFLDEIGELPGEVQVKLLRVLQERQIERLGSTRPIDIDVRVIAATNRDLDRAVADGAFREDLYYRLNVFPIRVPPLRERVEDIQTLVWAFVDEFSKAMGKRFESISKEHLLALQSYAWPGNVRELRNTVERAVILSTGPRLVIEPPRAPLGGTRHSLRLEDVERDHLQTVLEKTGWRIRGQSGAAELVGLKPSTLEDRMTKLGLRRPRP